MCVSKLFAEHAHHHIAAYMLNTNKSWQIIVKILQSCILQFQLLFETKTPQRCGFLIIIYCKLIIPI